MKLTKYIAIPLLLFALIFSCSKRYEDDPITMKFISLKKRIEGEWTLEKILVDGADSSHIIFDDNLKIFSKFHFKDFSKVYTSGNLTLSNHDNSYTFTNARYNFPQFLNDYFIQIYIGDSLHNIVNYNGLNTYGAVNQYSVDSDISWEIKKLTKKEMYLETYFNTPNYTVTKKYELFLKKN